MRKRMGRRSDTPRPSSFCLHWSPTLLLAVDNHYSVVCQCFFLLINALHNALQCNTLQCNIVEYSQVLHNTIQCNAILWLSTMQSRTREVVIAVLSCHPPIKMVESETLIQIDRNNPIQPLQLGTLVSIPIDYIRIHLVVGRGVQPYHLGGNQIEVVMAVQVARPSYIWDTCGITHGHTCIFSFQ